MKNNLDLKTMPKNYTVCLSKDCPRAEQCLRYLAVCDNYLTSQQLTVVNPAVNHGEKCKFYRENKVVTMAYGMKDSFHEVKADHLAPLHKALAEEFGRSNFYRLRDGSMTITPQKQHLIRKIFRRFGYEVVFDRMKDDIFWE